MDNIRKTAFVPFRTGKIETPVPDSGSSGFSLLEVLVAISLMAMIVVYIGVKTRGMDTEDRFYRTCYRMEEIKAALIGKPGLYCNAIRQFTGYVSDTGNLPNLYYTDDQGKTQRVTETGAGNIRALDGDAGLSACLRSGIRPQPRALWAKPKNIDKWQYHKDARLWAGWRGPYMTQDRLVDAWGNPFLFVVGEVIGHGGKTYRCRETYTATQANPQRPDPFFPGPWEMILENGAINAREWLDPGSEDGLGQKSKQEIYHQDFLTIISLGADNKPGGKGVNKDFSIVIEPSEYLGEVAGNCGDSGQRTADAVCLFYPDYTEDGAGQGIVEACIPESETRAMADNSLDYYVITGHPKQNHKTAPDSHAEYDLIGSTETDFVSTGITFRFGASSLVITKGKYHCTDCGRDEMAGCVCINYTYENHCYLNPGYDPEALKDCTNYKTMPEGLGILDFNYPSLGFFCTCRNQGEKPCTDATCVDNWDEYDFICLDEYGKAVITCDEEPTGCIKWSCDEEPSDCDCMQTTGRETYENPGDYRNANWDNRDIPIGIRTLKAGSVYSAVSVNEGGNWVGTVYD